MPASRVANNDARRAQYLEVRGTVHRKLLAKLNLEKLATAERSKVEAEIRTLVSALIAESGVPLSVTERDAILGDVIDEVFGFGPLEPLLRDKTVSDILVNTYKQVFVERARQARVGARGVSGRPASASRHRSHRQRRRPAHRRQLADGRRAPAGRIARQRRHSRRSRSTGPSCRFAVFRPSACTAEDLVGYKALTPNMLEFLRHCVERQAQHASSAAEPAPAKRRC